MNSGFIFTIVWTIVILGDMAVYGFLIPKSASILWWRYIPMSGYVMLFLHIRGKLTYLITMAASRKAQKQIRKGEVQISEYPLRFWWRVKQKTIDCFRIITNKQYILIEVHTEENKDDRNELTIGVKASRYRMTEEMMFVCMNNIVHEVYGHMKHNHKVDELIRNINNDNNPNMN